MLNCYFHIYSAFLIGAVDLHLKPTKKRGEKKEVTIKELKEERKWKKKS